MTTREVDGTTHWEGCHDFGPKHYACLLAFCVREETHHDAEVARLTAERDALRAALVVPHEVIEDMSMPHACSCRICGRQMRGPMVMDDQRRGRDITLECAVSRLLLAIEKLGENPPGKKPGTYFEASPSKDPESYKRWIELNDAGAFIRKILAARKSSERVET